MSLDLTGQRFGMLVVQSETEPIRDARGHLVRRYNCICDCGNVKIFRYSSLRSGNINSCGCTRFPKKPRADLTGMRFGSLTVVSEAEKYVQKSGDKLRRWNCLCDCGNMTTVLHNNLTKPDGIRSCGHCGRFRRPRSSGSAYDLTGNRYGLLTVLSQAEPRIRSNGNRKYMWLCRCDCGNETFKEEWNLISGHTRSCGCLEKYSIKGKKFGMLTVISRAYDHKGMRYWNCLCDCGNEAVIYQDDLFWGSAANCGCVRHGKQLLDLTGQRFGRLTVLREVPPVLSSKGVPERTWMCRCDCGREIVVRQKNLKNKVTRSCGCLRKEKSKKRSNQAGHVLPV